MNEGDIGSVSNVSVLEAEYWTQENVTIQQTNIGQGTRSGAGLNQSTRGPNRDVCRTHVATNNGGKACSDTRGDEKEDTRQMGIILPPSWSGSAA